MGRGVTRLFLYPIVLYFMITSPGVVKSSKYYLSRVFKKRVGLVQVARHIFCFSATILDRVYFITDQHKRYKLEMHNIEALAQHVKQNKGCILLGTHLGSFEVLRTLAINNNNLPLKILMYHNHNKVITGLLDELNPEINKTVIDLAAGDALFQTQEALEQGYCVGMLGDRATARDKVTQCDLLGDKATFPLGPLLLASILKVPVVLFFGLYKGGNRYDIYFEEFAVKEIVDRRSRDDEVKLWTQEYVNRIEYYINLAPYNWFNYFDYWDDYSN